MPIQAEVLEAQVRITGLEAAVRNLEKLDRKTTDTGKKVTSAGKSMRTAFAGIATGAAVVGTLRGLKGLADGASDLNETVSMSTAIFGKQQKSMERWAAGSVKAVGLSRKAALGAAAGFGDMFSQIGFSSREAAKMSRSVVQMSADLGSFKNLKTEDVADRLSAAFRGEYDSLQAVIPAINAARVETEAMTATGKKSAKQLTAQEKATAVLAIAQKDGKRAIGDFAKTQGEAAGQEKIFSAQIEDTKDKIGTALLPAYRDLWQFANNKLVPGVNNLIDGMKNGTGTGGELADMFQNQVVPALKDMVQVGKDLYPFLEGTGKVVKTLADGFMDLPGPLRQNILLLGGMSLAMSKVNNSAMMGGLATFSTNMSTAEGRTNKLKAGLQGLGGVLRNVGGAAGLMLVADSGNRASKEMGALEGAVGGALAGGSLGAFAGPWGAAIGAGIGGIAGGLSGMARAGKDAGDGIEEARAPLPGYIETLKNARKQITGMTRDQALQNLTNAGAITAGRNLGLSGSTVLKATLGDLDAMKAINKRVGEVIAEQGVTGNTLKLMAELGINQRQLKADIVAFNDAAIASGKYRKILGGLPPKVVNRVDVLGVEGAAAKIDALQRKYKLTPDQVTTILRAAGTPQADIDRILAEMKNRAKGGVPVPVKPDGAKAAGWFSGTLRDLQGQANRNPIKVPVRKMPGLFSMGGTITRGMAGGGTVDGAPRKPYGDKVLRMLAPGEEVISNSNGQADKYRPLLKAINAGGMAKGGTVSKAQKAAKGLYGDLKGMDLYGALKEGLGPVTRTLNRMEKLVGKRTSGDREKRLDKILEKSGKRLERLAEKRARVDAKLTNAVAKRDGLIQARDDFRSNVRSGIASQANVLNAGNSATEIAKNLGTQAAKAKEFGVAIQRLRKAGYSSAVIQQVAGAGIEGGLEIAKSLLGATGQERTTINNAFASITSTADQQAKLLGDQFYAAGIASAQGVVKGLKSEKAEIEKAMELIARGMIKALRKALGIKSPSAKFRAEMSWVGKGITKGLGDQVGMVSSGAGALAGAVLGGFRSGSATLTPAAMSGATGGTVLNLTFNTHNPIAEPQSRTTNKALARVAAVGLVAS